MTADTTVRARIDKRVKKEAARVLEDMGLSVSGAIRMMLIRVAAEETCLSRSRCRTPPPSVRCARLTGARIWCDPRLPPACSASLGFNADAGSHRAVPPRHKPSQKAGQGHVEVA